MPEEKAYCFKKDFDSYLTDIGVHVESQVWLVEDSISDIGPKGIDADKARLLSNTLHAALTKWTEINNQYYEIMG